jgi:hypothetical protein
VLGSLSSTRWSTRDDRRPERAAAACTIRAGARTSTCANKIVGSCDAQQPQPAVPEGVVLGHRLTLHRARKASL